MTGTVVVEQKQVPLRARVVHRKIAVARKVAVGLGRGATLRVHCGDRARKVIRQPAAVRVGARASFAAAANMAPQKAARAFAPSTYSSSFS